MTTDEVLAIIGGQRYVRISGTAASCYVRDRWPVRVRIKKGEAFPDMVTRLAEKITEALASDQLPARREKPSLTSKAHLRKIRGEMRVN